MGAKHKLNAAHFLGAVLVAGLVGLLTQSLAAFAVALGAMLAAGYYAGDIRK